MPLNGDEREFTRINGVGMPGNHTSYFVPGTGISRARWRTAYTTAWKRKLSFNSHGICNDIILTTSGRTVMNPNISTIHLQRMWKTDFALFLSDKDSLASPSDCGLWYHLPAWLTGNRSEAHALVTHGCNTSSSLKPG